MSLPSVLAALALTTPQHVRLAPCGPLDTTRCVLWNDASGGSGLQAQYGFDQTLIYSEVAETYSAASPLGTSYRARLDGLYPYSDYLYRVGGGGATSDTVSFSTPTKTGDGCLPVGFIAVGNSRSESSSGAAINWTTALAEAEAAFPTLDGVGKVKPALIIHTGHLVKDGASAEQWHDFLTRSGAPLTRIPLVAAPSDTDLAGGGGLFNAVTGATLGSEPAPIAGIGRSAAVTFGEVLVVVLDTELGTGNDFTALATWLDQLLTSTSRRFTIVAMHRPAYSASGQSGIFPVGAKANEVDHNELLVPVFDKHAVDLVLQGRGNYYQRFVPMKYDPLHPDQGDPVESGGTTYVVTGAAGGLSLAPFKLGPSNVDPLAEICPKANGSLVCDGRQHVMVFWTDGQVLKAEVWATSGQNDTVKAENIALIDSFEFTSSAPLECGPEPIPDVEVPDTGTPDTETPDAGPGDTNSPDAGPVDDPDVVAAPDAADTTPDPAPPSDDATSGASDVNQADGPDFTANDDVSVTPTSSDGGCQSGSGGHLGATTLSLLALVAAVTRRRSSRQLPKR
ncbi:MAG: hypothetical protein IV100_01875 [Myxococcales bacterium]|nr:hypothetical protein [Myxococcales bacterium]